MPCAASEAGHRAEAAAFGAGYKKEMKTLGGGQSFRGSIGDLDDIYASDDPGHTL